jgi:hypothetical protein
VERGCLPHGFHSGLVEAGVSRTLKDFHFADAPVLVDHGFHHDFSLGSIHPS